MESIVPEHDTPPRMFLRHEMNYLSFHLGSRVLCLSFLGESVNTQKCFHFLCGGGQTPKPDCRLHAHVSASLCLGNGKEIFGGGEGLFSVVVLNFCKKKSKGMSGSGRLHKAKICFKGSF